MNNKSSNKINNSDSKKNVSILGCGRWGTFLGWYSNLTGHNTTIWGRNSSSNFEVLFKNRCNEFLTLSQNIQLSNDLQQCIQNSQIIIISISSQHLRALLHEIKVFFENGSIDFSKKTFVLCMKGIEQKTNLTLTKVFNQILPGVSCAVWLGPGHVQSFVSGVPNCMVIDSDSSQTKNELITEFSSDLIRFYIGTDLVGNEVGAAAKNCVGIAAGMLDGLGLTSLKGALMARAPREIARLISALGGNEVSAYGLCHLGDYEATLFSKNSNNRAFGEDFVCKKSFKKLAEGITTLEALNSLSKQLSIDMPITNCLYSIFYENANSDEALKQLFLRPIKKEFI